MASLGTLKFDVVYVVIVAKSYWVLGPLASLDVLCLLVEGQHRGTLADSRSEFNIQMYRFIKRLYTYDIGSLAIASTNPHGA